MPATADARFTVDSAQYQAYMAEYLPLSFSQHASFDYNTINDRNNWVSIYDSFTWYGVPISGRFNLKAPKEPTPIETMAENSSGLSLVKEVKASLQSLNNSPRQWHDERAEQLNKVAPYNGCTRKQIIESEQIQHYLCLMAHEKYVMEHCIQPRLQQALGSNFAFFTDKEKSAYSKFGCLRRYRTVKKAIAALNIGVDEKAFLQSCLLHLMDHYYEHPTKKGPMDIINTVAYEYMPVLGLVFTISAIVVNVITPGAPVAMVLTYLGYVGFTSPLASLGTYLTNAYHGVWRPSKSIMLDLLITVISVLLGCTPMMIHAAGYQWYYTEMTTKYGSIFFDAITGTVNFFKTVFLVRDKTKFYYYPKALQFIRAIKHYTKLKVSSWIIYVKLGNQIFKDYSHWLKRLFHPRRKRHDAAEQLDAFINATEPDEQARMAEDNHIKYQAAMTVIPAMVALFFGLMLLSNPLTHTIAWAFLAMAAGLPTLWMIIHARFSISFQPSPYVHGQLMNHLAILAGSVTLGLCIMMTITPFGWFSIPFLLKDLALGISLSAGSAVLAWGFKLLAQHALTQRPMGQRICRGIAVAFVISAMVIAIYLALSLAIPACPPLIHVALHIGHSVLSGLVGMTGITLFDATLASVLTVALSIGLMGMCAGLLTPKAITERAPIDKKADVKADQHQEVAPINVQSFLQKRQAIEDGRVLNINPEDCRSFDQITDLHPEGKGSLNRRSLFTAIRLFVESEEEARPAATPSPQACFKRQ